MKLVMAILIMLTMFSVYAKAEDSGCSKAEKHFVTSLKDFRLSKGFYCQAYLNCATAYGFPSTTMNVDVILSVPGGEDPGYDSCMAPYLKNLNESAKDLTAWELARCGEHEPEADVYYLCGSDGYQARGGTANRHLAPLPLRSLAGR
jgi:hypothetical protein